MQISKLFPAVCAVSFCASLIAVRAAGHSGAGRRACGIDGKNERAGSATGAARPAADWGDSLPRHAGTTQPADKHGRGSAPGCSGATGCSGSRNETQARHGGGPNRADDLRCQSPSQGAGRIGTKNVRTEPTELGNSGGCSCHAPAAANPARCHQPGKARSTRSQAGGDVAGKSDQRKLSWKGTGSETDSSATAADFCRQGSATSSVA